MSSIGSKLPKLFSEGTPTTLGWMLIGAVAAGTILVVALLVIVFTVSVPLPDNAPGGQATEVLDSEGDLIGALKGEQKRQIVPLEEIAPVLQQAVVATEDRRFYEHSGISPRGMVRALFANVQAGSVEQGGSTITQQYARNAYGRVGTERTIARKIREIALARRIEASYSKDKILEFYLNTIYFGRGAYGAEAASLTYFKKSAKDLTLSEAAYMAGAIRSPENIQPDDAPEAVVRARNQVLNDMVATGAISQAEAEAARAEDVLALFQLGPTQLDTARAGFFLQHVRRLLQTPEFGFTDAELLGGGLTIETSLDLRMQDAAEKAVASVMDQPDDPEVAMIAMDPDGFVRAMVGGRDVGDRVRALGFNYAANVREDDGGGRQAGSALKPVALAAYLQKGEKISRRFPAPRSITIDERACRDGEGKPWTVSNFDSAGFGTVDVAQATANSVNTVYAQMMAEVVTPRGFIATSEDLGIKVPARDEGCALTLGTTDVTPLEMARAFTTFAARGQRPETVMIVRVTGPDGRTLIERSPRTQRVLDEDVADAVNQALQQVVTGGTGRGAAIGRPAAGKTGTTQNHLDAWFAGYTPDLTAVVWMGFAPGESGAIPLMTDVRGRRVTGGSFPATIWRSFMQEALKGTRATEFTEPKAAVPSPVPLPTCGPDSVPGPDGGCVPIDVSPEPELPDVFVPFEPDPEILPIPTPTRVPPTPRTTPTPTASPTPTGSPTPSPTPTPTPSPTPTQAQVGQGD